MQTSFLNQQNYLPYDGDVYLEEQFLSKEIATELFKELLSLTIWQNDQVKIYGKEFITKRKICWLADSEKFIYSYSHKTLIPQPFPKSVEKLKHQLNQKLKTNFNSCLMNLYHNGNEGMGWHKDNEPELGQNPTIASISLGSTRNFELKHDKSKTKITIPLSSGSLLIMSDPTQKHWKHQIPKQTKIQTPRINLTFRTIFV